MSLNNPEPLPASLQTRIARLLADTNYVCIALFLLCELCRLAYMIVEIPPTPIGLRAEPQRVAVSLLETGSFANPYRIQTGYTAHLPPLQPVLLAGIVHAFGRGPVAERVKEITNSVLCSMRSALMPILALELGFSPAVGLLTGLVSIWPAAEFEFSTPFETCVVTSLLILAAVLALRYRWSRTTPRYMFALQGVLWGVILLFNTTALLILGAWILAALWEYGNVSFRYFLMAVSFTALSALLVITPWLIRDYQRFHHLIFIRDNLGLELQVSNNDRARPTLSTNKFVLHPNSSEEEAKVVRELGEITYNRQKLENAKMWIRAHPHQFENLVLARARYFWFPGDELDRRYRYPVWIVTVMGFLGLAVLAVRGNRSTPFILSTLLVYPLVFYVIQTDFRYRFPTYPFSVLLAVYFASFTYWSITGRVRTVAARLLPEVSL